MRLGELETRSKLPYPEIEVATKNVSDAKLLMNNYAGKVSETTAIFQYKYQYYLVEQYDRDIAKILKDISNNKIIHHELLGKIIAKLGGDPIISGLGPFWNGSYVSYTKQLKKMIVQDISDEEASIRNYQKTAMCLTDKNVADLLNRIILDEEIHIKVLTAILEHISFWK